VGGYLIPAVDGVAYGLLLFTVAAGLTLAFGAGGVLNLAHGTLFTLGSYAAAVLTDGSWAGLALAVLVGAGAGAAAGGLLAAGLAPLATRGHLMQALFTFGAALVIGALLVLAFGPDELRPAIPAVLDQPVHIGGRRYPGYRLAFIGTAIGLAVAGWWLLTRTRWGARVRAMRDDPAMLACLGTSPRVVLATVMAGGGGLAGGVGALGAPIIGAGPRTGELVLLLSLIIVVVGGPGSVTGAFLAALAVGQVQSLGVVAAPTWAPYLLFAAMAIALVLRGQPTPLPTGGHR
jgi:branched-subunit amino acid ABC-type transport system permease component